MNLPHFVFSMMGATTMAYVAVSQVFNQIREARVLAYAVADGQTIKPPESANVMILIITFLLLGAAFFAVEAHAAYNSVSKKSSPESDFIS